MLISKQELFPTLIRKFQFNENEMSALLKEITNKKEEIKETSFFYFLGSLSPIPGHFFCLMFSTS